MAAFNYLDRVKEYIDFSQIGRLMILLAKTDEINYKVWRSKFNPENVIENSSILCENGIIAEKEYHNDRRREIRISSTDGRQMSINFGISPIYNRDTNEVEKICGRINIIIRINNNTALILNGVLDNIAGYDNHSVDGIKRRNLIELSTYCRIMSGDKENSYLEFFDLITDNQIGYQLDSRVVDIKEGQIRVGKHLLTIDSGDLVVEQGMDYDREEESYLMTAGYMQEALSVRKILLQRDLSKYVFNSAELGLVVDSLCDALEKDISEKDIENIKKLIYKNKNLPERRA